MEPPYIQDIVGNKKEAPGAPLPKQEKDIAFIVKRYINNEQESVCLLYYDEIGKKIIKGHTCTKRIEVLHHNDTQLNATKVLKYLHISVIFSIFAANYRTLIYECN